MKTTYALVVSQHDGSGVLRAFGPYSTEDAARTAQSALQALYEPGGTGRWDIVPLYAITTED